MFEPDPFNNSARDMQMKLDKMAKQITGIFAGEVLHLPHLFVQALRQQSVKKAIRDLFNLSGEVAMVGKAYDKLEKNRDKLARTVKGLKESKAFIEEAMAKVDTRLESLAKSLDFVEAKQMSIAANRIAMLTRLKALYADASAVGDLEAMLELDIRRDEILADSAKQMAAYKAVQQQVLAQQQQHVQGMAALAAHQANVNNLLNQQTAAFNHANGQLNAANNNLGRTVNLAKVLSVLKTGLISGATFFAKSWVDAYHELRERGQAGTQALGNLAQVSATQMRLAAQGIYASAKEVGMVSGQLGNQLGTINVGSNLLGEATFLMTGLKLSEEQAGKLSTTFFRMSNFSEQTALNATRISENLARKNMYPAGTLLRQMADDSDIFARHAAQGVEAFAKSEMLTRRLGTNLKSIEGFADRLVGNFEDSLKMQAELQTYMPDLDLSEVLFQSQFGSPEGVTKALAAQLKGRDFSQMPRSFQLAIQRNFGISFEELQNISKGIQPGSDKIEGYKPGDEQRHMGATLAGTTADLIDNNRKTVAALIGLAGSALFTSTSLLTFGTAMRSLLGGLGGGTGSLLSGLATGTGIAGLSGKLVAGSALGGLLTGGMTAMAAKSAGASTGKSLGMGLLSGGLSALGMIGGTMVGGPIGAALGGMLGNFVGNALVSAMLPKHHTGLLPNEFAAVLQQGEAVLTKGHQQSIANITSVATEAARVGNMMQPRSSASAAAPVVEVDTSTVETLLRQLIHAVKQDKQLVMDGVQMGKVIVNATSRTL